MEIVDQIERARGSRQSEEFYHVYSCGIRLCTSESIKTLYISTQWSYDVYFKPNTYLVLGLACLYFRETESWFYRVIAKNGGVLLLEQS